MKIKINELNMELQTRAETSKETVANYAELMRENQEFPPVTVFRVKSDSNPIWLVDGFHRVAAMRENGCDEIEANVIYGDHSAALTYALKANSKHGLQRSNADKRRVLKIAWDNRFELFPELANTVDGRCESWVPSSQQLATICGISERSCAYFIKKQKIAAFADPPSDEEQSKCVTTRNLKKGLDSFGFKIPERLLPLFNCKVDSEVTGHLRNAKSVITNHAKAGNMAVFDYAQKVEIDIQHSLDCIKFGRPFCVCPACSGLREDCGVCKGNGFVTLAQFRRIPSEFTVEHRAIIAERKRMRNAKRKAKKEAGK